MIWLIKSFCWYFVLNIKSIHLTIWKTLSFHYPNQYLENYRFNIFEIIIFILIKTCSVLGGAFLRLIPYYHKDLKESSIMMIQIWWDYHYISFIKNSTMDISQNIYQVPHSHMINRTREGDLIITDWGIFILLVV